MYKFWGSFEMKKKKGNLWEKKVWGLLGVLLCVSNGKS